MGFFDGLGRMIKGEPVFQPGDNGDGWKGGKDEGASKEEKYDPNTLDKSGVDASVTPRPPAGPEVLPRVDVTSFEYDLDDDKIDYYFEIRNDSEKRIELDKIIVFNTRRELDRWMNPGEERELLVYSGSVRNHQHYDKFQIQYKDESGDYFMTEHWIGFKQDDGHHVISQVKLINSVRDV